MNAARVAVDAPGGGPAPLIDAAVQAAREGIELILCGPQEPLRSALAALGASSTDLRIRVVDAPEEIGAFEDPSTAYPRKARASILVAADQVARGQADALVSAGAPGVAAAASLWRIKRLGGTLRPAAACMVPTPRGRSVLIDAGINADCKPWHLLQFALMGRAYARHLGIQDPSVAVLAPGAEWGPGNELVRGTLPLLRHAKLGMRGALGEAALGSGAADVFVCDGFIGAICLRLIAGVAASCADLVRSSAEQARFSTIARALSAPAERRIAGYGVQARTGMPLLGVDGTVVLCPQAPDAPTALESLRSAAALAASGINDRIRQSLQDMKSELEFAAVNEQGLEAA